MEKSYKPNMHLHRKIKAENVLEFLSCPCGESVWAFSQEYINDRPEIKHRKARYKYPRKFESY
jgi:hypothetical protein